MAKTRTKTKYPAVYKDLKGQIYCEIQGFVYGKIKVQKIAEKKCISVK